MVKNWKIKYDIDHLSFDEDVQVLDNFIPEKICRDIQDYAFNKASWTYNNQSEGQNNSLHWGSSVVAYPNIKVDSWEEYVQKGKEDWKIITSKCPALKKYWNFLKKNSPVKDYLPDTPTRALFNCSTGGHGDISHLDQSGNDYTVTHVLYLNDDLDIDDGGQTEFYDKARTQIIGSVSPLFGRVVILDGRIPHAGKAPWQHYTGRRITLGIQCTLINKDGSMITLDKPNTAVHNKLKRNVYSTADKVFTQEYDKVIPKAVCKRVIQAFEDNPEDRERGGVASPDGGEQDLTQKTASEIFISNSDKYYDLTNELLAIVKQTVLNYCEDCTVFKSISQDFDLHFEPLRIRKYDIGEFFNWHTDSCNNSTIKRLLAVSMYFNDVPVGGETEFKNGISIKPTEGKIVIFPASWTNIHRSKKTISNAKYYGGTFLRAK